jgi:hypothetical protein
MIPRTSGVPLVIVAAVRERQQRARVESVRDFLGVAAGVGVGALVWLGFLSLARLHP